MENKSDYFRFGGNAAQIQQIVIFYTIVRYVMNLCIWGQLRPGGKTNRLKR